LGVDLPYGSFLLKLEVDFKKAFVSYFNTFLFSSVFPSSSHFTGRAKRVDIVRVCETSTTRLWLPPISCLLSHYSVPLGLWFLYNSKTFCGNAATAQAFLLLVPAVEKQDLYERASQ
jgi:hypothetical protein